MGYFHEGHLALMEKARQENDYVVVSLFVNPIQFGPNEDFQRYPRDEERDRELAEKAGVDLVFNPTAEEMYGQGFQSYVEVTEISQGLCGASRPGHFRGVTTVITKLLTSSNRTGRILEKRRSAIKGDSEDGQGLELSCGDQAGANSTGSGRLSQEFP